jgi:hypothetical protein
LLQIHPARVSLQPGEAVVFSATGGLPPYGYDVVSGGGSLSDATFTAPASPGTAVVRVQDQAGHSSTADVTVCEHGFHDGGDGTCCPVGTCATNHLDLGTGACVYVGPTQGLVSYLPLDDDVADVVGGLTPTAFSVTFGPGHRGGAGLFNGTSSYVDLGAAFNPQNWPQYTISLWFWHDGVWHEPSQSYGQKVISKTTWYHDWDLRIGPQDNLETPGYLALGCYDIEPCGMGDGTHNYGDSLWHHVVLVRDAAHGEMWVEGVLVSSAENVRDVVTDVALTIGFSLAGDTYQRRHLSGRVDDVRFYNRVLSATEIGLLYSGL